MLVLFILPLLLACAAERGTVPTLELSPDTLVLREHLVGPGPERTGNWWARFDGQGCYTAAQNSWMWVHDPVLARSEVWAMHWNTVAPTRPWFCLTARQRARLIAAARAVQDEPAPAHLESAGDRWTVVLNGNVRTVLRPVGDAPGSEAQLRSLLADLAAEGVWGQSPPTDTGFDQTPRAP